MEKIKEIKLEKENISKLRNAKLKTSFKKNLSYILTMSPLLATALFITGSIRLGTAEKEYNYYVESTYDSIGNEESTYLTKIPEDTTNEITVYSPYEKNSDGKYQREYKVYKFKDISQDQIDKAVNEEMPNLDEIFGEPVTTGISVKDEIIEEEKDGYVRAKVYSIDENKTYYDKLIPNKSYWVLAALIDFVAVLSGLIGTLAIDENTFATREFFDRSDIREYNNKIKKAKQKIKELKSK